MSWRVLDSRPEGGNGVQLVWSVGAEDDEGREARVRVRVAEAAVGSDREVVLGALETQGRSVLEAALAADPSRLPAEIVVGPEGAQPVYDEL